MTQNGKRVRFPKPTAILEFDGEYEGFVVEVRRKLPIRDILTIQELQADSNIRELFLKFGDIALVAWNAEGDDGQPIPATGEGLLNADMEFVTFLIEKWLDLFTQVSSPLAERLPNGSISEERLTNLAGQSQNLSSFSSHG